MEQWQDVGNRGLKFIDLRPGGLSDACGDRFAVLT